MLMLFWLFRPFLTILILAVILATGFYPMYKKILVLFRNRARLASLTTCFLILTLIIIPVIFFVLLLAREAVDIYNVVQTKVSTGEFDHYLKWQQGNIIYDLFDPGVGQFKSVIDLQSMDLKQSVTDVARSVSGFLVSQSAMLIKGAGAVLLGFFILLFAMSYLFKDHKAFTQKLMKVSPLPLEYELELFRKFKEMSQVTLYGIFLVSIIKGALGGIGFWIAGIPNPLFWGTIMAFFSLVPIFGPTLIWLPAAVFLLLNGQTIPGVFLLLWGALLVSTIDNFFQAFFIGSKANLNPLLVFLAVLGGIALFGLVGVIFGPLILTIFFTFLHIYELEYKDVLHH